MYLKDLIKIICEDIYITIRVHEDVKICRKEKILWEGKVKDLKHNHQGIYGWQVVEVLVDRSRQEENDFPDYNKGKIIMVM